MNKTLALALTMRFAKITTQRTQGRGEPTSESQQQSYIQRMCSQLASLRVMYQSKTSNKDDKSKKRHGEEEATTTVTCCKRDELRPAAQDLVHHLGSSDSENCTISQYQHDQPKHDAEDAHNSPPTKQTPRYHLLSWGEAKTRIQQTTTMIRDICVTKSSALLSGAWHVYPRNQEVSSPPFSPSSGADTPPPKRRMNEKEQYEQWLMTTAGRESEISICMSYYSSRSLSDAATDSEDHHQQQQVRKSHNSSSSSFIDSIPRESEHDLFRRRCSSTDSYTTIYNERFSSGRNEDARRGKRGDGDDDEEEDEDEDFGDETIRDSLFLLTGKPYKVQSEWI